MSSDWLQYISVFYINLNKQFAFLGCLVYFSPWLLSDVIIYLQYVILQKRYLSINTRACLYALKCKFIVVLYFLFLQSS